MRVYQTIPRVRRVRLGEVNLFKPDPRNPLTAHDLRPLVNIASYSIRYSFTLNITFRLFDDAGLDLK